LALVLWLKVEEIKRRRRVVDNVNVVGENMSRRE